MTPGKDSFIYFEQLRSSAEYTKLGYVVVTPAMFADIKEHTALLSSIYNTTVERDVLVDGNLDSTFNMFMPWEMEDGYYIGTQMRLIFSKRKSQNDTVLYIMFVHRRQKTSPFASD